MLAMTEGEPLARCVCVRLRGTEPCLFARTRETERVEDIRTVVILVTMYRRTSGSDQGSLWDEGSIDQ